MKILVLADQGAHVDELVSDLEGAGHNVVVAGGRTVAQAVFGAVRPAAMLAVSDDPVAARRFLGGLAGAKGLPVLALPADAGADEVSLVLGALTGTLGPSVRRVHEPPPPPPARPMAPPPRAVPPPVAAADGPTEGHRASRAGSAEPVRAAAPVPVVHALPATGGVARARELVAAALEHARRGTYFELLGVEPVATVAALRQRVEALGEALRAARQGAPELDGQVSEIERTLDDAWYVLGDDELRPRYAAAVARAERRA